jgi:hypothetical protein
MEFNYVNVKIYYSLFCEYYLTSFFKNGMYNHFVDYKNIGVKYIGFGVYEVVDEKKWMLAKIKYGI